MTDDPNVGFLRALPEFCDFDTAGLAELSAAMRTRVLHGGECLFEKGAASDGLVILQRGRLAVVDDDGGVTATLGRGQVVGEIGALAGVPRTSTVVAMRDSKVLHLDQDTFDRLFAEHPEVARSLSRLVVARMSATGTGARHASVPATVALLAIGEPAVIDEAVDALRRVVPNTAIIRRDDIAERSETEALEVFDNAEARHDLVVLLVEDAHGDPEWLRRCVRQADAVVVAVPPHPDQRHGELARRMRDDLSSSRAIVEVLIDNPAGAILPPSAKPWLEALHGDRFHHHRSGDTSTADRFARLVTGNGVGLVFSGGAAKGLAHLGAWRALRELDVEIDAVAGVSLGALLAAGVGLDYSPQLLREEVDRRLVTGHRGLADLTFPWVSLLRGEEVSRRIRDVGAGREFEQVWRSFVCTSCDLVTGESVEHRTGQLWRAVRASLSIPGLFPPLRDGDRLLVDGAVRDNLPVSSLRAGHPTPLKVIAVDVGKEGFLEPGATPDRGDVSGWRVLAQRINPRASNPEIPTMVQVLMRVVDLAGTEHSGEPDVLIRPDLSSLGLSDFTSLDAFEQAGYDATMAALG